VEECPNVGCVKDCALVGCSKVVAEVCDNAVYLIIGGDGDNHQRALE